MLTQVHLASRLFKKIDLAVSKTHQYMREYFHKLLNRLLL